MLIAKDGSVVTNLHELVKWIEAPHTHKYFAVWTIFGTERRFNSVLPKAIGKLVNNSGVKAP